MAKIEQSATGYWLLDREDCALRPDPRIILASCQLPVASCQLAGGPRVRGVDRLVHQIADAPEKLGAHGGMKTLRVGTADREQARSGFGSERHECSRADFHRTGAEQKVAL